MPSKLEILVVNIVITSLMAASNFTTIESQIQSIANSSGFFQKIIESQTSINSDCPEQPPTSFTRE
ncbi:hypothetical protein [Laspinema olomoucense]|uniref:hypothetical protein n=1 Tax=Laspinema olomoucense TaxID=3231600 RepID=UPI0021BB908E|nr:MULTISPECIES: hypothetical protein [unclassified Laspinema]MCT7973638.1 hypothetical protein [Laspinema sp. D3d]MCT7996090.1 hypothetical protein [Laspinema sp. D3c]